MSIHERARKLIADGGKKDAAKLLHAHLKKQEGDAEAWIMLGDLYVNNPKKQAHCYKRAAQVKAKPQVVVQKPEPQGVQQLPVTGYQSSAADNISKASSAIGGIGCLLMIVGVALPCVVLLIGALFTQP